MSESSRPELPHGSVHGWYKSRSKSEVCEVPDGIRWSPVFKPTTIHRYFEETPFTPGCEVTFRVMWESDGQQRREFASNRDFECSCADPTGQGAGISDRFLRCMAGTGDFRIGFFQADKLVGNDTFEGYEEGATRDFNTYKGYQVRVHPHLSAGFKDVKGRLIEHHEDGKREAHNNISLWTRVRAGTLGLMSDQAQKEDHSGFDKTHGNGTQPQPWGANMPFGEPRELVVRAKRVDETNYTAHVTMNGNEAPVLKGRFSEDFRPEALNCMAICYTNQSRRYSYVQLTELSIDGTQSQ